MSRRRTIVIVLLLAYLGLAFYNNHPSQPLDLGARPASSSAGVSAPGLGAPPRVAAEVVVAQIVAYVHAVEMGHVADYVHAVQMADVVTYVDAVAASDAQVAAQAQNEHAASQRATGPVSQAPSAGGGACGGATNGADQYIHRESGGDPYIGNGGGHYASPWEAGKAFGCYQILPSTWASSCSDITTYDPASQARCASRLPDSAWAL